MTTPIKTRRKHSPEWLALRAKVRGYKTPEQRKEDARNRYRAKREKELKNRKPYERPHGMVKDKRTGVWKVGVPTNNGQKRYLPTGETEIGDALKVVDSSGLQRLSILARAKCLTNDAAAIIMHGHKTDCDGIVKAWAKDLLIDQAKNTARSYIFSVKKLIRDLGCGKQPANVITREQLYNFVNDTSVKESTRESRLAAIRNFYRHLAGFGHVVGNISSTIKINQSLLTVDQRVRVPAIPFTVDEYRRATSNPDIPQFWRWASGLGYWLGLRIVDVCRFEWASIGDDFVVLYPQKTGRRLAIPLSDPVIGSGALKAIFDEMRAAINPKEIYCFPDKKAGYPGPFRNHFDKQYKEVLRQCGIEGKSFHGWRHAFKLRLQASGKSLEEIRKLMGHAKIEVTEGYGRGELKEMVG